MKKRTVTAPPTQAANYMSRIGALAAWASLGTFFYYLRRNEILMLGDTVAHINIARRVFDSLNPSPLQLGTVWLPLPHLLMIPFLISNKMWQSGIGGSIPSMAAYVFGVVGMFRLTSTLLEAHARTRAAAQVGGTIAAFAYGANPNLLYSQATAITEPLYLAFFIWSAVYFSDFTALLDQREILAPHNSVSREKALSEKDDARRRALRQCGLCVACAELTRYDGWFLAGIVGLLLIVIVALNWNARAVNAPTLTRSAFKFLFGISIAPIAWLTYNAAVYGNPLAFANGPYSAKAIEARVGAPNPAAHNLWAAASYFLKSGQITLAVGSWGRLWLLAALVASAILAWGLRKRASSAILPVLWSPVVFYSLSIAYGSVPLHVPMWWPFAIFNQRFGLELLPLFTVSAGALVAVISTCLPAWDKWKIAPAAAALLILISYTFVWIAKPLCWVEASRNWEMRRGLDTAVELAIKQLPPHSTFLMDLGEHVGVMERLGIPLRRVVNTEDHRTWMRPDDPKGIWELARANPGQYVNYVIAFEGDAVDKSVNRTNLTLLEVIHSSGRPPARIYQTSLPANHSR
ncbi:MAG: hypothetical protein WBS24_07260 [Terriglobales bacterium]